MISIMQFGSIQARRQPTKRDEHFWFCLSLCFVLFMAFLFPAKPAWAICWHVLCFPIESSISGILPEKEHKVLVLIIDGLDPDILESLVDAEKLPAFGQLMRTGQYSRINMSHPPTAHYDWTAMSKGLNVYQRETCNQKCLGEEKAGPCINEMAKSNREFWYGLAKTGVEATVLFCPSGVPVPQFNGKLLNGLEVPACAGNKSRYTLVTTDPGWAEKKLRGYICGIAYGGRGIEFPLLAGCEEQCEMQQKVKLNLILKGSNYSMKIDTGVNRLYLKDKQWSEWTRVRFVSRYKKNASGICRFYLCSSEPEITLYCSPVYPDPFNVSRRICHPFGLAKQIAQKIGLFSMLRTHPDATALEDGVIKPDAFMAAAEQTIAERQEILTHVLSTWQNGLLVCRFDTFLPVQRLSWEDFLKSRLSEQGTDSLPPAIVHFYGLMDGVLSKVLKELKNQKQTQIIVVSPHGLADFRRKVHLNRVLEKLGYLNVKDNPRSGSSRMGKVDWTSTLAYAKGLCGVCLNRESIDSENKQKLHKHELLNRIRRDLLAYVDLDTKENPFRRVIITTKTGEDESVRKSPDLIIDCNAGYRISRQTADGLIPSEAVEANEGPWRGDYVFAGDVVCGVLLARFKDSQLPRKVESVARYILSQFNVDTNQSIETNQK